MMEENRKEQIEALTTLKEFNERLIKNMHIIIKELSGQRLDDTNQFLKSIIDAMNWEIAVMNGTMSLLNEGKVRINKEQFNQKAIQLSDAVNAENDTKIAQAIADLVPEFEGLGIAAGEVISE